MRQENKQLLCNLLQKDDLLFTTRCDRSTENTIRILSKKCDVKTLALQEEGGWFTYPRYAKPNNLKLEMIKMDNGRIQRIPKNAIIVVSSSPAYSYVEDMKRIHELAQERGSILINDVCGSVGKQRAMIGDIAVGSFGNNKPLTSDGGGFVAFNNKYAFLKQDEKLLENSAKTKIDHKKLRQAIKRLDETYDRWKKLNKKILQDLQGFDILNKDNNAKINLLVKYQDESQKERLIKYLTSNNIQYVECPKYIRTKKKALSIEIKRH